MPGFVVSEQQQVMCKAAFWGAITAAVHERILPGERASIPGRRLRAGLVGHGRRLRVGQAVHGGQLRARRPGEREAPAAHTLTEALLPTTCVVVNKPPGLKHFPTTGATPRLAESRSRLPRNRRRSLPLPGPLPGFMALRLRRDRKAQAPGGGLLLSRFHAVAGEPRLRRQVSVRASAERKKQPAVRGVSHRSRPPDVTGNERTRLPFSGIAASTRKDIDPGKP